MEAMNRGRENFDNSTSVAETLRKSAGMIRDEVVGVAHEVQGAAKEHLRTIQDEGTHQLKRVEGYVKERPLTALAITLGLGFIAGAMCRRS